MELSKIKTEVDQFLKTIGYDLYNLEIVKVEGDKVLRIYIDKEDGITIDDVILVTQEINPFIDALDPIEDAYMLEVSSPGAERELRSKEAVMQAKNRLIYLESFTQKLEGDLIDFDGDVLSLKIKNKTVKVNYAEVQKIRLAIDFRRKK